MVSLATLIASRDVQCIDFPHHQILPDARKNTSAAAGQVEELSGLRHASIVYKKAIGRRGGTFRSPLSADFAGLRVKPAAALDLVVDVDEIVLVLLGPQYGRETAVVGAD